LVTGYDKMSNDSWKRPRSGPWKAVKTGPEQFTSSQRGFSFLNDFEGRDRGLDRRR
jgi:hypothetical protein